MFFFRGVSFLLLLQATPFASLLALPTLVSHSSPEMTEGRKRKRGRGWLVVEGKREGRDSEFPLLSSMVTRGWWRSWWWCSRMGFTKVKSRIETTLIYPLARKNIE